MKKFGVIGTVGVGKMCVTNDLPTDSWMAIGNELRFLDLNKEKTFNITNYSNKVLTDSIVCYKDPIDNFNSRKFKETCKKNKLKRKKRKFKY